MLLGFQKQFAPQVESGAKRCTIRGREAKPGEALYLYTGLRTKVCRKLGVEKCKRCRPIIIREDGVKLGDMDLSTNGDSGLLLSIANDDGFATFSLMRTWFRETHGLPFAGYLIEW